MPGFVDYKAPKVASAFMSSNARMRVINGPFGSGKSSACMIEIVRRAMEQKAGPDGLRKSRWAVVRNTMPQLRDTTLKTWFSWFPDGSCGYWRETGKTFYLEFGNVKAEVIFRALDDESDVKNLLSLELTGAYINEAREILKAIVDGLDGRINRYPAIKAGGASWTGIWADTNPPEDGSFWHLMMEGLDPEGSGFEKPNDWDVYQQPPGLLELIGQDGKKTYKNNPDADNIENLPVNYYFDLAKDKTYEYIKVYILGKYGTSKSGKPVHPLFQPSIHVANEILRVNPNLPIILCADFGLTPAIAIKQQDAFGRVLTLDEIVTEDMGLRRCIQTRLKPLLRSKYNGIKTIITGDPAGKQRAQTDENTCLEIFREEGYETNEDDFPENNTAIYRVDATDQFLGRITEVGAAYLVSPNCTYLKRGLGGKYAYPVKKSGTASDKPEKNIFSHICEASQYGDMFFVKGTVNADRDAERKRILMQAQSRSRAGAYTRRS